jgi:hypothetical protein
MYTCKNAVIDALKDLGKPSATNEVIDWIFRNHPEKLWQKTSIRCHLIGLSKNHPSSKYYPTLHKQACLYHDPDGKYRLSDVAPREINKKPLIVKDSLYSDFDDPSKYYLEEPRAFCYEVSSELIKLAKDTAGESWYGNDLTIKGILLLLFTWNFASPITKKLNFNSVRQLMGKTQDQLRFLEEYSITNADEKVWNEVASLFDEFNTVFGQTGASKALSLLNPHLFVMWDTRIRKELNHQWIQGIGNGETGDSYVTFLKGIQWIIEEYNLASKLPPNSIIAKKIDEYHFVRFVMNKEVKKGYPPSVAGSEPASKYVLPDHLRGRSIFDKVIPTVCNLRNMLEKLIMVNGDPRLLKPWERRSYEAYQIERVKARLLKSQREDWKGILRDHILRLDPQEIGASCIDIYLVAYVSETYGSGKTRFFEFIKDKGISQLDNSARAIWQVGKGDGVFLDLLKSDGSIKDYEFFKSWLNG